VTGRRVISLREILKVRIHLPAPALSVLRGALGSMGWHVEDLYLEARQSRGWLLLVVAAAATCRLAVLYLQRRFSLRGRLLRQLKAAPGELPIVGHFGLLLVRTDFTPEHI
jgi:hypothetical protein